MINYELVIVLPGELDKEKTDGLSNKLKDILRGLDAKIERETDWGVKRLAYPIKKSEVGHYFVWDVDVNEQKVREMRRLMNFETELLRYMLLKVTPQ